jgi:integrase/recombinase XerD
MVPPNASEAAENYVDIVARYERALEAKAVSEHTAAHHRLVLADFAGYLTRERIPLAVKALTQAHVEGYLTDMLTRRKLKTSTVYLRFADLRAFFVWLEKEGEIDEAPTAKMRVPRPPSVASDVVTLEQVEALQRACSGSDFYSRRDLAIVRILFETGVANTELVTMRTPTAERGALDLKRGRARIQTRRGPRLVSFGQKTVDALKSYLAVRKESSHADQAELWLSRVGAMSVQSVDDILKRRSQQAGLPQIQPSMFRHSFEHARAIAEHKRLQRGDRV